MGLARALATSAARQGAATRRLALASPPHHHPRVPRAVGASSADAAAPQEEDRQRRRRQHQALTAVQQRRCFHATRRHENPILIGVVIIVGATIARYVIRAARRVSKEEGGGSGGKAAGGKERRDGEAGEHAEGEGEHPHHHHRGGFPVLGLDVGTLQSCVAFAAAKDATPLVVENHEGRRSTPAYVTFEDGHLVVGQLARRARWREPARVGFNLPRLLGTPAYDDALRPLFPFPVQAPAAGQEDKGLVLGLTRGGGRALPSGEVAARLVEDLVQSAEHKAHKLPRLAVLAVPSSYDAGAKHRALLAAQEGTGLGEGCVEVIEDAIAALACAHYSGRVSKEEAFLARPWLVCDVGGLNAQLSVVHLDPEHGLVVKGHATTWAVGGDQLDGALVRFLVEDFKKKHGGLDLGADYLALERLYDAAEAAKVELSSKVSSTVRLPFITADHRGPKHLDATLSRAQFEGMVAGLLAELDKPFLQAIQAAGLTGPGDLQGVILTGGTSRLPFLASHVAQLAKPADPPLVVLEQPEEAAALGAAYFGRELVEEEEED